ncbi:uncharacterized protein OCT59_024264 [Rhizophagus irregularis]|uniref:uncharacterized protein n=1 Tax=Rhizophagus irregularis TaxID=588596 RepID=UPI001C189DE9|nr:hypothetical protein OCT59_024264 [Rhizophagus irregularis]CAB4495554.1 unnamed protein product [Rhizophagus irregularis]
MGNTKGNGEYEREWGIRKGTGNTKGKGENERGERKGKGNTKGEVEYEKGEKERGVRKGKGDEGKEGIRKIHTLPTHNTNPHSQPTYLKEDVKKGA